MTPLRIVHIEHVYVSFQKAASIEFSLFVCFFSFLISCFVCFFCIEEKTCSATGDPHYTTFDDKRYDFMGQCKYVLSKDLAGNQFEVLQGNEACGNGEISCTKSLTVNLGGLTIFLERGGLVKVNENEVSEFPYVNGGIMKNC